MSRTVVGRALSSRRTGTARLVATDASVSDDRFGVAWVGDDGTWWLHGTPEGCVDQDGRRHIDVAEFRAVAAAVQAHPSRVLILTDSQKVARTVQAWVNRGLKLRVVLREFPEIVELRNVIISRWETDHPVSVRWAPRGTYELNKGADQLSKLAALFGTPASSERTRSAQGLLGVLAGGGMGTDWRAGAQRAAARAAERHAVQMRVKPPLIWQAA